MGKRKYTDRELEAMSADVAKQALAYWETADVDTLAAGRGWYPVANAEARLLSEGCSVTVKQAAAVIAVLSPLTRWQGNLEDSWNVCRGLKARHSLPRNVLKARAILDGDDIDETIGGKKVTAFYHNILEPLTYKGTVNDSWIARAFGIDKRDMFSTFGVYAAVTRGLQIAAASVNVLPSTMQATVWLIIRNLPTNPSSPSDNLPIPF